MTLSEKILAYKSGEREAMAGQIVNSKVDLLMVNDITGPLAMKAFENMEVEKPWDNEKIAIVLSHFVPAKDVNSANNAAISRRFAKKHSITHLFDESNGGIEHSILPDQGLVKPGDVIIGADSHSCTYGAFGCFSTGVGSTDAAAVMATGEIWLKVPKTVKLEVSGKLGKNVLSKDIVLNAIGQIGFSGATYMAMEWHGKTLAELSMDARMTMTNMAIECGAKNGVIGVDGRTEKYVKERTGDEYKVLAPDAGANYEKEYSVDADELVPQVACPHLPSNVKPASELSGVEVDQVYIGSCTNGRYEDLEIAAGILKGKKVARGIRVYVVPATHKVYRMALENGLLKIFDAAGCIIGPPTCGACLGGHMGVVGDGEVCLSTTNRNFPGRMGSLKSQVYLASPATAAASALTGRISDPGGI